MKSKYLFPLIAILTITGLTSAHAQVSKSGGLFGFKKKGEQVSGDLFPEEEATAEDRALQEATNVSVESDHSKKKKSGGLFFGKKADDTSGRPAISPTPVERAEKVENSGVAANSTPQFEMKDDKKKGGGFPFFKKDKDSTTDELQAIASNPLYSSPEMVTAEGEANTAPAQGETIVQSDPENSNQETVNNAPVPNFVGSEEAKKEDEGGLFSRVSIPKMPKRKTDYVEVETVMKDGEFVKSEEVTNFSTESTLPSTGQSNGPEIINGVKVYSSWDEVEARSVSEADRIINNIR